MIETVSTLEMRQRLGDLLNRVALRHDQFVIERKGKPLAAMVPVERLEQMQEAACIYSRRFRNEQAIRLRVTLISWPTRPNIAPASRAESNL
jgi:prevent-host-death family protein